MLPRHIKVCEIRKALDLVKDTGCRHTRRHYAAWKLPTIVSQLLQADDVDSIERDAIIDMLLISPNSPH